MSAITNLSNNLFSALWNKLKQFKLFFITTFIIGLVSLYLTRAFWYYEVNLIRQHTPELITIFIALFLLITFVLITTSVKFRVLKLFFGFLAFLQFTIICGTVFVYITMSENENNPFNILNKREAINNVVVKELEYLPLTSKERIYPYETILKIARDKITSSSYTVEHFEMVYDNNTNDLYWNAEKSPTGDINKLATNVTGIVSLNATSEQILKDEVQVEFNYGRKLKWFNSLNYILPKMLSLGDYFDKTIDDNVRLIKTNNNEWVQVVGVTDWVGVWPSTYPKFAGVFVINQKSPKYDSVTLLNTDFFVSSKNPEIKFYTPEQIKDIDYLKNQNLVPTEVTKFYAESWTFKNGIFNFFVNKEELTKITKIKEEINQQPFTVYFEDVKSINSDKENGLYQFYALEPRGANTALSDILLFDSKGTSSDIIVYNYNTNKNKLNLLGPERISKTIQDNDKHLDWSNFIIAESRPFIRDINGVRTFYFFNSIIAKEAASAKPTIAIADPDKLDVFWYRGNNIVNEINNNFQNSDLKVNKLKINELNLNSVNNVSSDNGKRIVPTEEVVNTVKTEEESIKVSVAKEPEVSVVKQPEVSVAKEQEMKVSIKIENPSAVSTPIVLEPIVVEAKRENVSNDEKTKIIKELELELQKKKEIIELEDKIKQLKSN